MVGAPTLKRIDSISVYEEMWVSKVGKCKFRGFCELFVNGRGVRSDKTRQDGAAGRGRRVHAWAWLTTYGGSLVRAIAK